MAKAKALLAEAQAIQQGLARAGIDATIKPLDEDSLFDLVTGDSGTEGYDLTLTSWQPDYPSANEPTSALDVSVQARILELLLELQRERGFACLFISHDLAVVEQLADRVAVMHQGTIVEQGTASRVFGFPEDPYTRRLLAAAPIADPDLQRQRREGRRPLELVH